MTISPKSEKKASPFSLATPKLSSECIAASVRDELRRLQRRRRRLQTAMSESEGSGSESDGGITASALTSSHLQPTTTSSPHTSPAQHNTQHANKRLFNFREVGMICERILREREEKIREEYDKVLSTKLQEQYDMFVRFTQDQIVRNFENSQPPSYLS